MRIYKDYDKDEWCAIRDLSAKLCKLIHIGKCLQPSNDELVELGLYSYEMSGVRQWCLLLV